MTKVLVTGGAGFIGSNFVHYMLDKYPDYEIVNLDALTYCGNLENLEGVEDNPNYTFVKGDIRDHELVDEIARDVDYIVHFAAESHVDRSIEDPEIFIKSNILGTQVLLDAAKKYKIKKYLQVSTDEVYGTLGAEGYFTEETPLQPNSPYSASKAGADLMVRAYYETFGLPVNITRCSNNYGPYQFPEKLIPLMISNALEDKELPVYGDGKNIRDWLYVEDHCKGIDMVQEKGRLFETYNIGGHNERENIQIVKTIISTLREELSDDDPRKAHVNEDLITYVTDRKGHDRRYAIAPDKIKAEVGWYPETTFEVGIKKTIKWYFEHAEWMEHVTSGNYQKYYEDMYSGK